MITGADALEKCKGKTVVGFEDDDSVIVLIFSDGSKLTFDVFYRYDDQWIDCSLTGYAGE